MSELEESHELIESCLDDVYSVCDESGIKFPVGWARLRIDMTLMPEEDRRRVYEAEKLLHEAGVVFDTGSGCGYRDWELDWSLSGAFIDVSPISCLEHSGKREIEGKVYWAVFRLPIGRVFSYAHCSEECRLAGINRHEEMGWEFLYKENVG